MRGGLSADQDVLLLHRCDVVGYASAATAAAIGSLVLVIGDHVGEQVDTRQVAGDLR